MRDYNFLLKFQLPSAEADIDATLERLAEAGCTDALVGVGQPGRIALDFTRRSTDALKAITSAASDVKKALPEAHLIEAGPDLVGISDIAELAGVSRQNIRKLMLGHFWDFPPPVHDGNPSIWRLLKVLLWLERRDLYKPPGDLVETAQAAMTINIAKEEQQAPFRLPKDVLATLS